MLLECAPFCENMFFHTSIPLEALEDVQHSLRKHAGEQVVLCRPAHSM